MKDLFMQLRKFGRVVLSTTESGQYFAWTEFTSPDHTTIRVTSVRFETPEDALSDCIEKCKETVSLVLSLELPK
jgi:hypothetical protein